MNETSFTISLIIVEIMFLLLNLRALHSAGAPQRVVWTIGVGLLAWLGIAYTLLSQNLLSATGVPQLAFVAVIVLPIILGLLAQRFWQPFRAAIDAMSTETFLSLQQTRVVFGVMFFLTAALPLWFQLIGGLGDIAAGVGAFVALRQLQKNPNNVARAIIEGNIIGILDFVVVLNLGVFVVLMNQSASNVLSDMFNLIPLVVVPVFILLHIFSLQKLKMGHKQVVT